MVGLGVWISLDEPEAGGLDIPDAFYPFSACLYNHCLEQLDPNKVR